MVNGSQVRHAPLHPTEGSGDTRQSVIQDYFFREAEKKYSRRSGGHSPQTLRGICIIKTNFITVFCNEICNTTIVCLIEVVKVDLILRKGKFKLWRRDPRTSLCNTTIVCSIEMVVVSILRKRKFMLWKRNPRTLISV